MPLPVRSQRTDLRLGAIAALSNAGVQPFPTIAEDRVFDTRSDPMSVTDSKDDLPAITVYTDTTKFEPIQVNESIFKQKIELIVEISVSGPSLREETDASLERRLDEFEAQVITALFDKGGYEGARKFSKLYKVVESVYSMRLGNSDIRQRFAMRDIAVTLEVTTKCQSLDEVWPEFNKMRMTSTVDGVLVNESIDTF